MLVRSTALLTVLLSTAANENDCGSPSYTGFALKSKSACKSYVYCQSGVVTSETTCPEGLLFNGGVGLGGICTWPETVVCLDDDDEEEEGSDEGGTSTIIATEAAATTEAAVEVTTKAASSGLPSPWEEYLDDKSGNYYYYNPETKVTQWDRPDGNDETESEGEVTAETAEPANSNPNNYYCGQSRDDAALHCHPCPSGSLMECRDVTHGCFANVDSCANRAAAASVAASSNSDNSASLNDMLNNLANSQGSTISTTSNSNISSNNSPTVPAPTPSNPSPTVVNNNNASPTAATVSDPILLDEDGDESTYKPTESPTLPPWTNAPFVPYRGAKRDKTVIGYYASWQWYDRNKFADPKNIDFSKYDRINYAFFQPDKEGNIYGTDEWADPQLLWGEYDYAPQSQVMSGPDRNYFCSWDGPLESQHKCATHKGDGIIALAKAAGAQVMPSIGGWTLSDNFPTIAATEAGRHAFAANCVKLIEEYDFDGIDIDWEYPAYEDHSGTPEDTVNYTYFLQAIRDALDKLGEAKGRYFPLTAALPCGPDKIEKIQVDKIKDILDELNLMSYDLHGAWDLLTGTNAPMFDQGWTDQSKRWSVHGCTEAYLEYGVDVAKINLGLPFYGRSFRKATGMKQVHEGADDINFHLDEGSPQYFNIVKALGRMTTYRHEKTQTQYAVFDDTGGLVSYDDARAICDKVHYANERGMHGFLVWEISGDMLDNGDTPLIDATNAKIDNPNLDCSTLRDPLWALSDTTYHYAPPEPETVDWSSVSPLNLAAPMGYSNGDAVPMIPAPTPTAPSTPTGSNSANNSPTLNSNTIGIPDNGNNGNTPSSPMAAPTPSSPMAAPSSNPDDCPPDHTGYWASSDCTKYMYCQAGAVVGTLMPCVPGTLFDVTTATCAFAANVPGCSR